MNICILCKRNNKGVVLRTSEFICFECLLSLESSILEIQDRIDSLRSSIFLFLRRKLREQILALENEQETKRNILHNIYEKFWDLPPDWEWRRQEAIKKAKGRCHLCNRRRSGSVVPCHVHHKIPKYKPEGNHSFDNLILLCEICHGNISDEGHKLVKESRDTRIKSIRHRGYRRRTRGFGPITGYLISDKVRFENLKKYLSESM